MEEQILEIIDLNHQYYENDDRRIKDYTNDFLKPSAKEITSHIMEFIEWICGNCEAHSEKPLWYVYRLAAQEKDCFLSTEELYQYWLTNVYKK